MILHLISCSGTGRPPSLPHLSFIKKTAQQQNEAFLSYSKQLSNARRYANDNLSTSEDRPEAPALWRGSCRCPVDLSLAWARCLDWCRNAAEMKQTEPCRAVSNPASHPPCAERLSGCRPSCIAPYPSRSTISLENSPSSAP